MTRVICGLALAAAIVAGPLAGDALARPAAVVSLGDSFISGEGGRWLGNGSEPFGTRSGTDRAARCGGRRLCDYDPARVYGASEEDGCHRSDVAPIVSARIPGARAVNLACSGAKEKNVWPASLGGTPHFGEPPQADQLAALARSATVRLVVLTVGANDVGFGGLVVGCGLDWARSFGPYPILCRGEAQAEVEAALPRLRRGLRRALRGIREALAAAGQPRAGYRLAVMGYASPFPAGRWFRYPQQGWSRLNKGGCPVWDADADWAAGPGIGAITAAMRAAARASGAEFLDLREALDGHQLCDRRAARVGPAGPSPAGAEWVRRLAVLQGSSRESLHPNAYGQRAIGACLGLFYAAPSGDYTCRDTPGRGFAGAMRIEPLG